MRVAQVIRLMPRMHRPMPVLLALLALAACNGEQAEQKPSQENSSATITTTPIAGNPTAKTSSIAKPVPIGSGFDFYVLSLSWSPTWCLENDPKGRSQQCAAENSHGFIVHGLWPQNEQGYPEFCRTREPDRVPEATGRGLFDIMPSMGLIGHQWRKHGSCSGLRQRDYFAVLRAARERVTIPASLQTVRSQQRTTAAEIETLLATANPGLQTTAIAVGCDAGRVEEVRICFNKDLSFRACDEIDRRGCKAKTLSLPATP